MPSEIVPPRIAARIGYDDANSGLDATEVQSAVDNLTARDALGGGASPQGTRLLSGGVTIWVTAYEFDVSSATYYIAGVAKTSSAATVTLAAADATFNRFDVITVNDSGIVEVLQGEPSAAAAVPSIDPNTHLLLTIIRVDAGTTTPVNISAIEIYNENTGSPDEWTGSLSGSGLSLNSTTLPNDGTYAIEGSSVANGSFISFQAAAPIDVASKQTLAFYLQSKASWPKSKSIAITFRSSGVVIGQAVSIANGFFGFSSENVSTYQMIAIPISQFNLPSGGTVDSLRFQVSGGGASIGFHLDNITIQGNPDAPPSSSTGITQAQADARYAQRAANLSDLPSTIDARINLNLADCYSWVGAGSGITIGVKVGKWTVRRTGIAFHLSMDLEAGSATIDIEASTDNGATWPTVIGTISGDHDATNTATISVALAAGTKLRANYTSVTGAEDVRISLYVH